MLVLVNFAEESDREENRSYFLNSDAALEIGAVVFTMEVCSLMFMSGTLGFGEMNQII